MGEVTWSINLSLDGRCGHEEGVADDHVHRESAEAFGQYDTVLLGRKTYDLMFPFWSTLATERSATPALHDFAVAMTEVPKVVFSRTLDRADWNTRVVNSSPVDEVRRLREQDLRLNLGASPALAAQLVAAGLVDRFHFVIHPVVAGRGPMLFGDGQELALTLDAMSTLPGGHVVVDYSVAH